MKKILKSRIFLVIITMVVSVGTTVCGAILYNANQVSYTPSDTTWNVDTVDKALNDLYNTANTKLNSTTATAEEILSGKVAYSRGNLVTGTMANRGAVNATIDPGASYTIPAGYHNGSGKVTANNNNTSIEQVYRNTIQPITTNANTPNTVTFEATKTGNLIIDINYDGGAIAARAYPISVGATNCTVLHKDSPTYNSSYSGYLLGGTCIKGEKITVTLYAWNDAISSTYSVHAYII